MHKLQLLRKRINTLILHSYTKWSPSLILPPFPTICHPNLGGSYHLWFRPLINRSGVELEMLKAGLEGGLLKEAYTAVLAESYGYVHKLSTWGSVSQNPTLFPIRRISAATPRPTYSAPIRCFDKQILTISSTLTQHFVRPRNPLLWWHSHTSTSLSYNWPQFWNADVCAYVYTLLPSWSALLSSTQHLPQRNHSLLDLILLPPILERSFLRFSTATSSMLVWF